MPAALIYTLFENYTLSFGAELIDIGYEAPAGQMYSSADDLSKLMMLIVNGIDPVDQHNPELVTHYEHPNLINSGGLYVDQVQR